MSLTPSICVTIISSPTAIAVSNVSPLAVHIWPFTLTWPVLNASIAFVTTPFSPIKLLTLVLVEPIF